MAQIGNTATPASGFISRGDGTNQVWSQFTMPSPGGLITTLHAYCGTFTGGTATGKLCVWDPSGALLGSVSVSIPQEPGGAGAQTWVSASPASPIYVPAGACFLGFWTPSASGFTTSSEASGSSAMKAAGSAPSSLSGSSSTGIGALGVYADYTPGSIYAYDGSTWQSCPVYAYDGSTWQLCTVWAYDGSAWQQIG